MNTFFDSTLVRQFSFPDGQPHLEVLKFPCEVRVRICNPTDLFNVLMLMSVYRARRYALRLKVMYLMGSRMDRAISDAEPFTLREICKTLWQPEWDCKVSIFCPHSDETTNRLGVAFKPEDGEEAFFDIGILNCISQFNPGAPRMYLRQLPYSLVFPDKGAKERFGKYYKFPLWHSPRTVVLAKTRELSTGKITGMEIVEGSPEKHCVIVDDLCDGGATFIGAAKCLRESGAEKVGLVVAHGVFSKGIENLLDNGIDHIHTSNSYRPQTPVEHFTVTDFI